MKINEWFRSIFGSSAKEKERRFIILMDYENLVKGLGTRENMLHDFSSWLIDPIRKVGKIELVFVFFPEYLSTNPPIETLSHIYRFFPIICPKKIPRSGGDDRRKESDTVDFRMYELAQSLIRNYDFTDLVIVSGDKDHVPAGILAKWQQKKVLYVSAEEALSDTIARHFETKII